MLSFALICILSSCEIVMFSEVDSGPDSNPFLKAIDISKSRHVINEHKKFGTLDEEEM